MLKELFDAIGEQAVNASVADKVHEDNRAITYLLGDKQVVVAKPPQTREHKVSTLDDIIQACNLYAGKIGTLWHNDSQIVLLIDDADRRDRVAMSLVKSEQFMEISKPRAMNQADFSRWLRYRLADCVPTTLVGAISKINFASAGTQSGEASLGRERGTREFMVEIVQDNKPPEIVDVAVSVYANAGLRQRRMIRCGLDFTMPPANVEFRFATLPDELEVAIQNAQAELHQLLVKAVKIPVFAGTP